MWAGKGLTVAGKLPDSPAEDRRTKGGQGTEAEEIREEASLELTTAEEE